MLLFARPRHLVSLFSILGLLAVGPLPGWGDGLKLMQKSPGMTMTLDDHGGIDFSASAPGVGIAGQHLDLTAQPGQRIRLKVMVEKSNLKDKTGAAAPNIGFLNETGTDLCLALTQMDAAGKPLDTVFSHTMLSVDAPQELTLETFCLTGAASYSMEIRAVGVTGDATVDSLESEVLPALPDPVFSHSWVQRNAGGALGWNLVGKPRPLDIYFGNNQFGKDDEVLNEMLKAVSAGVSDVSFGLPLPGNASDEEILGILSRFLSKTGDTPFMVRTWMAPPRAWLNSHPEELLRYEDGTAEGYASPSSVGWLKITAENCDHLMRLISSSPYGKRFAGILPLYYQTGEWVIWDPAKQGGFDAPTRTAYQGWLRAKYPTLDALNAAWGSTETDWNTAARPPTKEERIHTGFGILRTAADARAQDWATFYATIIPTAIDSIAGAIKKASGGQVLVGVFYGYTVEMAYSEVWPQQSGHLGLGQALESPNLDFVGSPYSYSSDSRAFGMPMNLMAEADSPALHGKLCFVEEDTFTHLAEKPDPKLLAPGYAQRTHDMEETLAVLSRNLGSCISHNLILHWDNLLSDGRFDATEIWDRYQAIFPWMLDFENSRAPYQPEVACVIDEKAYLGLSLDSKAFYRRWLYQLRSSLARLGTPVGIYLQSDLAEIPKSVRCLILPTSFSLTSAQMDELKKDWLQDGRMAIFCWLPPGAAAAHSGDTVSTIPGLPVVVHGEPLDLASKIEGDLWSDRAGQIFSPNVDAIDAPTGKKIGFGLLSPYATVPDGTGTLLARYTANNEGSCAWYQGDGFSTAFLGALVTSPLQWRGLLVKAGCHFYLDPGSDDWNSPDIVQGSGPFLMIQSGRDGSRTISWPKNCAQIQHWNGQGWQPAATSAQTLDWTFKRGVPEYFLAE
jgi:hypothetical protein